MQKSAKGEGGRRADRAAEGVGDPDRVRLPRAVGQGDRRAPHEADRERRELHRRQELADAAGGAGSRSRRAAGAARRPERDRLPQRGRRPGRGREGACGLGSHDEDPRRPRRRHAGPHDQRRRRRGAREAPAGGRAARPGARCRDLAAVRDRRPVHRTATGSLRADRGPDRAARRRRRSRAGRQKQSRLQKQSRPRRPRRLARPRSQQQRSRSPRRRPTRPNQRKTPRPTRPRARRRSNGCNWR